MSATDDVEVSRDPSEYAPTDHYVIRTRREFGPRSETRTAPPITSEVTRTCIVEGRVERAQGGRIKFIATVGGVEWNLIAENERVLTAYAPDRHDPEFVGGEA